jgi:predicted acetyltransferase
MLDRSDDNWRRARNPARKPSQGVLILEDDEPTGYARWVQLECDEGPFELLVSDHAVATPVAARRLLAFLADHGTMARKVFWFTGPGEPLLAMLDTTRYELKHSADWLLRLLDVRAALEARGYPAGVQAELHLELEDSLFEENRGRFVLRVAAGRGALERGGDGRLCTDVRGLAPLYSGYVSAAQLRLTGQVAADDATCATAAAVFAGPAPWMPDYF